MATITLKRNPNYREVPFGGNDGDVLVLKKVYLFIIDTKVTLKK